MILSCIKNVKCILFTTFLSYDLFMIFSPESFKLRQLTIGLKARMIWLVCLLLFSLVLVAGGLYTVMLGDILESQIEKRALQVSRAVAQIPLVKQQITKPRPEGQLQALAEKIRLEVDAEFIVIGNRDGVRFSHPKKDRLGKKMVGGDNVLALRDGRSYVSYAVGTLGPSIRGKTPVFADNGAIIGVVSVGYLQENVADKVHERQYKVAGLIGLLLFLGAVGAISISNRFKKEIFNLEPEQIAQLFTERATIIESIREGIVAIDREAIVTVTNQQAITILDRSSEKEIIGQPIAEVLPGSQLSKVITRGEQHQDHELVVNGITMIINTVPMSANDEVIGAVASFRRKDELDILAKQFSQVKEYSEMLRSQTHEYSNKLHTIAGLIQIGHDKEALDLIGRETAGYQGLVAFLAKAVPFPVIAAFIIGKYNHAHELRVDLEIDPDSQLNDVPPEIGREKLLTILGNLLDNAFDAAILGQGDPKVRLSMTDVGNNLVFEVEDSGKGIPAEKIELIFQKGYSTKQADRGHGLHLVQEALKDLDGELTIGNSELGGMLFSVFIPKRER